MSQVNFALSLLPMMPCEQGFPQAQFQERRKFVQWRSLANWRESNEAFMLELSATSVIQAIWIPQSPYVRWSYKNDHAYIQAGGGIVADSSPSEEYQESLNKAKALLRALDEAENISKERRETYAFINR